MINYEFYENVDIWVQRHLDLCDTISSWSKDPSSQFGCYITDAQHRPIGLGFNGFARGFNDTPERWNDRPFKYRHVIHAEENAILNSTRDLNNTIAYVNGCPCSSCMSKLSQVGVKTIYCWKPTEDYLSRWSVDEPLAVANETNMNIIFVHKPKERSNDNL